MEKASKSYSYDGTAEFHLFNKFTDSRAIRIKDRKNSFVQIEVFEQFIVKMLFESLGMIQLPLGMSQLADVIMRYIKQLMENVELFKNSGDAMNVKEAAKFLGVSESSLNHGEPEEAFLARYHTIGSRVSYHPVILEFIRLYFVAKEWPGMKNLTPVALPINEPASIPEPDPVKKRENKYHFEIDAFVLEKFIDICKNDNLDAKSATLMKDRFSKEPKDKISLVPWKGSLNRLMTFAYLSDRFGFISRENKNDFQRHDTSKHENKEKEKELLGGKEVRYIIFVKNNFKMSVAHSEATLRRKWEAINEAILKLRKNKAKREDIGEDDITEDITRKEAILYYFKNKENKKNIRIDNTIDEEVLDLFYEIWRARKNK